MKRFDTFRFVRETRDKLYLQHKGKTDAEMIEYYSGKARDAVTLQSGATTARTTRR
jgi:hypothetical protein